MVKRIINKKLFPRIHVTLFELGVPFVITDYIINVFSSFVS